MSNRKRKKDVFAVNTEVVMFSSNKAVEREDTYISMALEIISNGSINELT